ncbi:MAG: hypothetical protein ACOC2C_06630, partial [Cyclonatronaceae bacterium]
MEQNDTRSLEIRRWFELPALFWLLVAALVGIWIRLEWYAPMQSFFAPRDLIHAHTHAALLGWVYLVMSGFTLRHFVRRETVMRVLRPMSAGLQLVNLGMLVAFALQGYAFWSILFSAAHLFLTLWLAVLFVMRPASRSDASLSRRFAASAWFWQVVSGFGPIILAATGGMSGGLAEFWLGSYLFLLLNGWIIFMMLSMWLRLTGADGRAGKKARAAHHLMHFSLFPALLSMFYGAGLPDWMMWTGFGFNLMHSLGILLLLPLLWKMRLYANHAAAVRLLLGLATLLLGLKAGLQILSYYPELLYLTKNHLLRVAFLHLVLLGLLTPLLLYFGYGSMRQSSQMATHLASLALGSGFITTLILFWMPLSGMLGMYL